jgi:hypothetical protein
MKNLMSACPKELVEVIYRAYPDYWPLTQEQICYYLLREVKASEVAPMGLQDEIGNSFPYNSYLHGFLGLSLEGPPFLTGDRSLKYYTAPNFAARSGEKYIELWVDDGALVEFLRIHSKKLMGIPVYEAGSFHFTIPAQEAKDRFVRMEKTKGISSVVLYLADLDAAGHRRYDMLTDHFAAWVDLDRVGLNVEHVPGLLCKPTFLCDDEELREDRFFSKELSLPGCYALSAPEPPKLIEMVRGAVKRYQGAIT